ncbi:DUF2695 domain-containing protein [Georgenia ruanii]|uniref:DUF2695 domain-containing protein n=1 Tax=Georgenia ruanii TaxID=348442 RepID=A0A7J9UUR0_9MICO|nr:DUF2695 domain-containing protein [Georgenia ruanii]MPV88369.1 DUF2695 domain-containing protein [Georgenia ruanii]
MSVDEGVHMLELELAGLAESLTAPRLGECLMCFANRMVAEFGCDHTLRWSRRYQQLQAPQAYGLRRRLLSQGICCDCDIFARGWDVTVATVVDRGTGQECWPPEVTGCRRVRRGSTRPCTLWAPRGGVSGRW